MIYDLVIDQGYGSHRLAALLNEKGYKTHKNAPFTSAYVLRILKNPLNRGVLTRGGVTSEPIPDLRT